MDRKKTIYEQMIIKDTGCTDDEVQDVEDIMRNEIFHSTLDWQTRAQFRKGAREAYQVYKVLKNKNLFPRKQ